MKVLKSFKYISIFLTILLFPFESNASSIALERAEGELQVRQLPGSDRFLRDYFRNTVLTDTIYCIVTPTGNCPRCEALIPHVLRQLNRYAPDKTSVLISVFRDSTEAKKYNSRYGLAAEINIYDTTNDYNKFLSFSIGDLHIPYILKIAPESGNLIVGMPADDDADELIADICRLSEPLAKLEFPTRSAISETPALKPMRINRKIRMNVPDTVGISAIINQPELYGNRLFFNDKLDYSIQYYKIYSDSARFITRFKTDSTQNRLFVTVNDNIYKSMIYGNEIRFMPLSPRMLNDSVLAVSYSLPKIWAPDSTSIAYKNQACVYVVNPDNHKECNIVPLIKPDSNEFFYPHFDLFVMGNDFVTQAQRLTWPIEVDKDYYCGKADIDPFMEDFYSNQQPILAIFDSHTGNLKSKIGQLPELARKSLTGYYFVSASIASDGNRAVYSDGVSGNLHVFDIDSPENDSIVKIFDIDLSRIPMPDEKDFYSYDCIAPYTGVFIRNIMDVKIKDDDIYCLLRYGIHGDFKPTDTYSVIKVNNNTGVIERKFPIKGAEAYGLWTNDTGIHPYLIDKINGEWEIVEFEL